MSGLVKISPTDSTGKTLSGCRRRPHGTSSSDHGTQFLGDTLGRPARMGGGGEETVVGPGRPAPATVTPPEPADLAEGSGPASLRCNGKNRNERTFAATFACEAIANCLGT